MNASYHHRQSEMSATEAQMVEASLRSPDLPSRRKALEAIAEQSPDPDWDPRDREMLRPRAAAPGNVAPSADVKALFDEANALVATRREVEAEAKLHEVEVALGTKGTARHWRAIAATWQRLSSPSLAVTAAMKADADTREAVKSWSIGARRRFAIPFDAAERGLQPSDEGRYARTFERGLAALAERDLPTAEAQASALAADFPSLPAPTILRCGVFIEKRAFGDADKTCEAAKASQEDSVATWRFLSMLASALHKTKQAEAFRARAIELDR
jgi:hypothetical protein